MNILIISLFDWAGVANALSEAVNLHTSHICRQISLKEHRCKYPIDLLVGRDKIEDMQMEWDDADVIMWGASNYRIKTPFSQAKLGEKKEVIWRQGSQYRLNYSQFNEQHKVDMTFAHRDLLPLCPEGSKLLDVPFDVFRYPTGQTKYDKLRVCHSPVDMTNHGGGDKKGTRQFVWAVSGASVPWETMTGLTWAESVKRKKKYNCFYDQIGSYNIPFGARKPYGLSLVEAATMGHACLGWSDYDDVPMTTVTDYLEIQDKLIYYKDNLSELKSDGKRMRRWVEKTHSYEVISRMFVKDLEELF